MKNNAKILNYIQNLDIETAMKLTKKMNIGFTYSELNFLLPYLKNHASIWINEENLRKKIHEDLHNKISVNTELKINLLFDKLGIN